jgi:hypothetical protein
LAVLQQVAHCSLSIPDSYFLNQSLILPRHTIPLNTHFLTHPETNSSEMSSSQPQDQPEASSSSSAAPTPAQGTSIHPKNLHTKTLFTNRTSHSHTYPIQKQNTAPNATNQKKIQNPNPSNHAQPANPSFTAAENAQKQITRLTKRNVQSWRKNIPKLLFLNLW